MRTLGEMMDEMLSRLDCDASMRRLYHLWQNWEMVMGPELAELALPLGHRHATLLVCAEDNMALQELAFQTGEILERVNAFMDAPFFDKVELHLGMGRTPLTSPPDIQPSSREPLLPERPEGLRGELKDFDPESPAGCAYLACLHLHGLR